MSKDLVTEIDIEAPADRVWQILTDFASYPSWNPFVRKIEGPVQEGAQLEVALQPPGRGPSTFRPKIVKVVPGRELRWLGHLGVSGLFDGEHRFQIEPLDGSRVRFVHAERFDGLLASPLLRSIGESTRQGFQAMNEALKSRAEGG